MAVDTGWVRYTYNSGSAEWLAGGSPVTVGNGSAYLAYRRVGGVLYWKLSATVGTTTVLPAGDWSFEMPGQWLALPTDVVGNVFTGSGMVYVAAVGSWLHVDVVANVSLATMQPYVTSGSTLGNLSKTVPGAWASGDVFVALGWAPIADN